MSRKKPKPNDRQTRPHENSGNPNDRPEKRHVYIDPGFKVDLVQDLKEEIKTSNTQNSTHNTKQLFWSKWAAAGTIVATIFVGIQGLLLYQSNKTNREALTSVQRAFIVFNGVQGARRIQLFPGFTVVDPLHKNDEVIPTQGHHVWDVNAIIQNSGATPAVNVRTVYFNGKRDIGEPNETEIERNFRDFKKLPATLNTIGPKGTQTLQWHPAMDEELFSGDIDRSGDVSKTVIHQDFYMWGWVVYRDVFPDTEVHLTEFCQHLYDIRKSPDGGHDVVFLNCHTHNCTDRYCPDYDLVMKELNYPAK